MKFIFLAIVFILAFLGIAYIIQENNLINFEEIKKEIGEIANPKLLNLSNQELQEMPSFVFESENLEELNVSNNRLTGAIPAEIGKLRNLKILNLSNNLMTGVPAEVGSLESLEVLDLSNNYLTGLPYEIGNLKSLKVLNLSGNNYSKQDLEIIRQKLSPNVNIIE